MGFDAAERRLLAGRSAIVTGAARGNGAAIARALAEHGANVLVADIDGAGAERQRWEIAADTGVRTVATTTDVSRRDEVDAMFDKAMHALGRVDVVVNNAGILRVGPFVELTPQDWFATLDVNLTGAMWCCRRATEHMLEVGGGSIVNITSMAADLAPPNIAAYCVSKGGLQMLTRAMAVELAPAGIRVNAIAPAVIRTAMTEPLYDSQEKVDKILERIPMARMGLPEDVAGAAVFLASDLSRYVTGATINVDGGYMVR